MKNLLKTVFTSAEERVKNPFIGAFITSWVIFNWKPIALLMFSNKTIEQKIDLIEIYHSSIFLLFVAPLISTIFYVLILPYLSLMIDEVLKYSKNKRNANLIAEKKITIENRTELAIAEIEFEENKTKFQERNTHNKLVEELQRTLEEAQKDLHDEKMLNTEIRRSFNIDIKEREDLLKKEMSMIEGSLKAKNDELFVVSKELRKKNEELQKFLVNNDYEQKYPDGSSESYRGLSAHDISFDDGLNLTSKMTKDGEIIYYDVNSSNKYTAKDVELLKKKARFIYSPRYDSEFQYSKDKINKDERINKIYKRNSGSRESGE